MKITIIVLLASSHTHKEDLWFDVCVCTMVSIGYYIVCVCVFLMVCFIYGFWTHVLCS